MKVMSLNVWCGNVQDTLMPFLVSQRDVIDIFCFQEVHDTTDPTLPKRMGSTVDDVHDLFVQLQQLLPGFTGFFSPRFGSYGQAMFVKRTTCELLSCSTHVIKDGFSRNLREPGQASIAQYTDIKYDTMNYRIINVHGLWMPSVGKDDIPERIEQSEAIVDIVKSSLYPVIICGDFNLNIDTESIRILERAPLRNLIREYDIESTRSALYTKSPKYADYIFVSPEVPVQSFVVFEDEVSDHLPLCITI